MIRSIKCIHLIIIQINFEEEWVFEKIKKWEWGKKWMNDNNKTTQIVTHTCAFAQWSKSPHFTHHFTSLHSSLYFHSFAIFQPQISKHTKTPNNNNNIYKKQKRSYFLYTQ